MRRLWRIGALLVFVAAPPAGAQQPVIKVGVVVDVTGGASSLGVPERNTVLLYQDDLGTAQGPNGPVRIEYVVTDGESDPTKAVIAAKRLIEEDRVVAVVCCRSEEHTSELQSHSDLVCRLLLEKKKNKKEENT